jgi:geranylgeranylglycerol-phosphate geranylgeranyltransferase
MKKQKNDKFSFLYDFTHIYKVTGNNNHVSFPFIMNTKEEHEKKPSKIKSYLDLIRYKNILPTLGLTFAGGYIVNPYIGSVIKSPNLLVSLLIIIGVMSSSMIMNDLFDMKIDKLNNPNRPLISGYVSEKEAHILNAAIMGIVEIMNLVFLPRKFQYMIHMILFSLFIYTPKIKKVTFLKNIFCAYIVSFASSFSAMIYSTSLNTINPKNMLLLKLFTQTVFLGSFFNEIILDIRDREGDYCNNIKTIPVIYGNSNALVLASGILKINFMWNMYRITELFGVKTALFVPFVFLPIIYHVKKIRKYNYDKRVVIDTSSTNTKSLLFVLVYYCILAKNI